MMNDHTISVAVIGAGMAGRTHANAWRQATTIYDPHKLPQLRYAAICDAYEPFAQDAARAYGYDKAVTDWHEIAEDPEIDVVSIVVANSLHREIALELIKAGKHVLCEKPLTDNLDDARAMAEAAAAADVVTGVGFGYRRQPGIAEIAKLAEDGALGDIVHFTGRYTCDYGADPNTPTAWRYKGPMGSGALGDVGSHLIDTAEFVCGPIKSVSGAAFTTAITMRPPAVQGVSGGRGIATDAKATEKVENDDAAIFTAHFESGAVGSLTVSRVTVGDPNQLEFEVSGTKAKAAFDMSRAAEIKLADNAGARGLTGSRRILVGPDFPYFRDGSSMAFAGVGVTQIDQFTYQARAFLDQVAGIDEGLAKVPGFDHGYRAMRIQAAVAESAANGGASVDIK